MYNCSLLGCSQQVAANIFMFVFKKKVGALTNKERQEEGLRERPLNNSGAGTGVSHWDE